MSWEIERWPGLRDPLELCRDSRHELKGDLQLPTTAELAGIEGGGLHVQPCCSLWFRAYPKAYLGLDLCVGCWGSGWTWA